MKAMACGAMSQQQYADRFDKCMEVQGLMYDQWCQVPHASPSTGATQLVANSTTIAGMFNDARGIERRNNLTITSHGELAFAQLL